MAAVCLLPASTDAQPDPDALARRAAHVAGSPYDIEAVQFTFVVVEEGVERKRRSHVWCPRRRVVEVSVGDDRHLVDLQAPKNKEAHAWFINDSYWLFAPAKLLDHGVRRAIVAGQLELTFDSVGLTSGDRYLVHIDPRTGLVDRWSFNLETGRRGAYRWADYRKIGPLWLAASRQRTDGKRKILFENLSVLDRCPL